MLSSALARSLRGIVGLDQVVDDPAVGARYLRDWTGRFGVASGIVVRPGSTAEVSQLLRFCEAQAIGVVPQGGNTGLVGGGVPRSTEVVLSLARLNGDPLIDPSRRQVLAGSGVSIAAVQRAAATAGLRYGVDLASRDSATVGGTVATNAGGLRVLRFGDTRAQLIGVEAVLADGTVVSHLDGHTRDNTGYHLPGLLAGSEGTLAVVTAARLRLLPPLSERVVVMIVGLGASVEAIGAAAKFVGLNAVTAVELMMPSGIELVTSRCALPRLFPVSYDAYLLVETLESGLGEISEFLESRPANSWDVAIGQDPGDAARLWSYRERHTESIALLGTAVKMDVTLHPDVAAEFLERVPAIVASVSAEGRVWLFGHIGDGNVHVNVTGVTDRDRVAVEGAVFTAVAGYGGSISTEHGVGVAKRPWLHLNRSEAELATFTAIKNALDPTGILNPGVLL